MGDLEEKMANAGGGPAAEGSLHLMEPESATNVPHRTRATPHARQRPSSSASLFDVLARSWLSSRRSLRRQAFAGCPPVSGEIATTITDRAPIHHPFPVVICVLARHSQYSKVVGKTARNAAGAPHPAAALGRRRQVAFQ